MASIKNVSDFIIQTLNSDGNESDLSALKLQKLLYYTQAWHLAFYDKPLFEGKFEAWIHGPVNREIYDLYKGTKYAYSTIGLSDVFDQESVNKLSKEEILHIQSVLDSYAKFTPSQLEYMSHSEAPWIEARGGISSFKRCENVINEDLMRDFYKSRLNQ